MGSGLWKHQSCLDLDFLITKVTYIGPTYIKCKMLYIYKDKPGSSLSGLAISNQPQTVKILKKDFNNWIRIR